MGVVVLVVIVVVVLYKQHMPFMTRNKLGAIDVKF